MKMLLQQQFIVNTNTAQKKKISIEDLFSKCDQICNFLQIWSHLLKQSLMENFIFSTAKVVFLNNKCFRHLVNIILS